MDEHATSHGENSPESSVKKREILPGQHTEPIPQNPNLPFVDAEIMKAQTGLDHPATMAIELGEGLEARRLLIVPVERGKEFNADLLVVDPEIMSLEQGVGFKGVRVEDPVVFGGHDERTNARFDLGPNSPMFAVKVNEHGEVIVITGPKSSKGITTLLPSSTAVEQPASSLSITERLGKAVSDQVTAPETSEASADAMFASPDTFRATLENPETDQQTRLELLRVVHAWKQQEKAREVTELWRSKAQDKVQEISRSATDAVLESSAVANGIAEFDGLANQLIAGLESGEDPDVTSRQLMVLQQAGEGLVMRLDQARQSDELIKKCVDAMDANDGFPSELHAAVDNVDVVADPQQLRMLVEAHQPGESLAAMATRLNQELDANPDLSQWRQRADCLETLAATAVAAKTSEASLSQLSPTLRSELDALNTPGVSAEDVRNILYGTTMYDVQRAFDISRSLTARLEAVA